MTEPDAATDSTDEPGTPAPEAPPQTAAAATAAKAAKAAPGSRARVFRARLISTLSLWAVVVAAFVLANRELFYLLFLAVVTLGLREYFRLLRAATGFQRFRNLVLAAGAAYAIGLYLLQRLPEGAVPGPTLLAALDPLFIAGLLILIIFTRLFSPLDGRRSFEEIAYALFGFVYIALLLGFAVKTLDLPLVGASGKPASHLFVFYLFLVTKFTDMGAYLTGSLIGKHKMIPHISPGKTWQGFAGSIAFALIAAFGCRAVFPGALGLIPWSHVAPLAVALALLATLGDLTESILKRSLETKDSGHVIAGIGGVLDLVDSILFTAPAFYLYLLLVTQ